MWKEDIIMILFKTLSTLYKYLITVFETMPMEELTMKYMTACLMHEMSKRKEKEPQEKDVAMMSRQSKADNPPSQ